MRRKRRGTTQYEKTLETKVTVKFTAEGPDKDMTASDGGLNFVKGKDYKLTLGKGILYLCDITVKLGN